MTPHHPIHSLHLAGLLAVGLSCAMGSRAIAAEPTPMSAERRAQLEEKLANLPKDVPAAVREVYIDEHAGDLVPMDLTFRDSMGKKVKLADYFDGEHPVLLTLNYYRCPKLCDAMLNGTAALLDDPKMKYKIGSDYQVITLSFDPAETSALAKMKRSALLNTLDNKQEAGLAWSFLVGEQPAIDAITAAVGFRYTWLDDQKQYAHPAAIIVLSPEGKITRYIYGTSFVGRSETVWWSLVEASQGKVGSPLDLFLLTCFHYSPSDGKYTATAMGMMRIGGALTVVAIVGGIGLMLLNEYRKRRRLVGQTPETPETPETPTMAH